MTEPRTRLEQALTELGREHQPPDGWEARVLAATRQPPPRRWWWWMLPLVAVAAVFAMWLAIDDGHDDRSLGSLELIGPTFDKPGTVVRAVSSPHAGDIAHVQAIGGLGYRAIWIYRDDQLVLACPGWEGQGWCRAERGATVSDVPLGAGHYEILVLSWGAPLPPSTGSLDRDLSWVMAAGVATRERSLTIQ